MNRICAFQTHARIIEAISVSPDMGVSFFEMRHQIFGVLRETKIAMYTMFFQKWQNFPGIAILLFVNPTVCQHDCLNHHAPFPISTNYTWFASNKLKRGKEIRTFFGIPFYAVLTCPMLLDSFTCKLGEELFFQDHRNNTKRSHFPYLVCLSVYVAAMGTQKHLNILTFSTPLNSLVTSF